MGPPGKDRPQSECYKLTSPAMELPGHITRTSEPSAPRARFRFRLSSLVRSIADAGGTGTVISPVLEGTAAYGPDVR
eukprot:7185553-Pyramimonas_sp.AAC.1